MHGLHGERGDEMNRVCLTGRLGRDPELKQTPTGASVVNFSIAVKDRDTTWIDCVAWNKAAEAMNKFCRKGMMVGIDGHLSVRSWEADGQKKSKTEVVADRIDFLSDKVADDDDEPLPF